MQLYLVQHGASKSDSEDPQRSLTDDGRQTVEQMADLLSSLGLALDIIEHSDKLRARATLRKLPPRGVPRRTGPGDVRRSRQGGGAAPCAQGSRGAGVPHGRCRAA